MATLTFDTYNFITRLESAEFNKMQAKALVKELQEVELDHLATKGDIKEAISDLKVDMLKYLIPILLSHAAVFAVIMKSLLP